MILLKVFSDTKEMNFDIGKRVKMQTNGGLVETDTGQIEMNYRHITCSKHISKLLGCKYIHEFLGSSVLSFRIDETGSIKAIYFTFGVDSYASHKVGQAMGNGEIQRSSEFILTINDEVIDINEELAVFNMIGYTEGVYDIDSKYVTATYEVKKSPSIGSMYEVLVTVEIKCEQGFDKLENLEDK